MIDIARRADGLSQRQSKHTAQRHRGPMTLDDRSCLSLSLTSRTVHNWWLLSVKGWRTPFTTSTSSCPPMNEATMELGRPLQSLTRDPLIFSWPRAAAWYLRRGRGVEERKLNKFAWQCCRRAETQLAECSMSNCPSALRMQALPCPSAAAVPALVYWMLPCQRAFR